MARESAPRALRRPISLRRWLTMELMVVPTPTSVSTSTTSETIQNRVCSMAMMRVSDEVILVTVCALTAVFVFLLILLTMAFSSSPMAFTEYSTTSAPRLEPASLATSAVVA